MVLGSTAILRSTNEAIVNKIISANLPAELSNYFLFDAMKTSDLVEGRTNQQAHHEEHQFGDGFQ